MFGFGGRPGPRGWGKVEAEGGSKVDGEGERREVAFVKKGFTGLLVEETVGLLKFVDVGFIALSGMRGGSMVAWMGSQ